MNSTTYIARATAARRAASETASDMSAAIRSVQMSKGYESLEASAYTLGYLESFLVGQICELPVKYREHIINEMRRITTDKLNSIKELA